MQLRPRKLAMPLNDLPSYQNPPPTKDVAPRKPATKVASTKRGKTGASAPKPGAKSAAQVGVGGAGASGQAGAKGSKCAPPKKGASSAAVTKPKAQPDADKYKKNLSKPWAWSKHQASVTESTGGMGERAVAATGDPRGSSNGAAVATGSDTIKDVAPPALANKAPSTNCGEVDVPAPTPGGQDVAQARMGDPGAGGRAGDAPQVSKRVHKKGAAAAQPKPPANPRPQPTWNSREDSGASSSFKFGGMGVMKERVASSVDPLYSSRATGSRSKKDADMWRPAMIPASMQVHLAKLPQKRGQKLAPYEANLNTLTPDDFVAQAASTSSQPDATAGELLQSQSLAASQQRVVPTHDDTADALQQQMQRLSARTPAPQEAPDATTAERDHQAIASSAEDEIVSTEQGQDGLQPVALESTVAVSSPAIQPAVATNVHENHSTSQVLAPQPASPSGFKPVLQGSDSGSATAPMRTSNNRVTTNTRKRARDEASTPKAVNNAEARSLSRPKRQRKNVKPAGDLPRA